MRPGMFAGIDRPSFRMPHGKELRTTLRALVVGALVAPPTVALNPFVSGIGTGAHAERMRLIGQGE